MVNKSIVQVAVPVPLRRLFDYEADWEIAPGTRVLVPFGRRRLVGVVVAELASSAHDRLRAVLDILDQEPVISPGMMAFLRWVSSYYHHPIGETLSAALPVLCRTPGEIAKPVGEVWLKSSPAGEQLAKQLGKAPKQREIHRFLESKGWTSLESLRETFPNARQPLNALVAKGMVERRRIHGSPVPFEPDVSIRLTESQHRACKAICDQLGHFGAIVLQGITGSGKTEVYLEAARACIQSGHQVLFLVPEIALTPQLVGRVRAQLGDKVYALHSGMGDRARFDAWARAREGVAEVVLGTRSAIFAQMKRPGLIIVDEEHDLSYKQQDGLLYHARDLAIKRGKMENIPVVLGSATPSLETLHNVDRGRYQVRQLNQRFGAARLPRVSTVNLEAHTPTNGLSAPLMEAIGRCLENRQQTILYINRRGYAPLVRCYSCDWEARCERCSAALTFHRTTGQFRCHHCGFSTRSEFRCSDCGTDLFFGGAGTQRIEQALRGKFPGARVSRLDRDEANTANKLYRQLEAIRNGDVDIVVGTQLITKGHDFARVSLVGIVNADQGLFSADFRAPEVMFQQLLQVAGRAGRASADGEVLIQTRHADHPVFGRILAHDYAGFAADCLAQRAIAGYPPNGCFALLRSESENQQSGLQFLESARIIGENIRQAESLENVTVLFPVSSPMEMLAGRYRAQLLVKSTTRAVLHRLLGPWIEQVEALSGSKVRWSIDVDPMDMS